MTFRLHTHFVFALVFCMPMAASGWQELAVQPNITEAGSSAAIAKIIEIGTTDNHVQDHLDYLTNRIGPRLTGSEGLQAAC